MDLDVRQTRNFLLAGTAAVPTPYGQLGSIAFDVGSFRRRRGVRRDRRRLLTVIQHCGHATVLRVMLRSDIAALYIHGDEVGGGPFQMSPEASVDDFEKGEWFLGPDIRKGEVRRRLNLRRRRDDISTRDSILRGVAFVIEGRPVFEITEAAHAAGEFEDGGYPCCGYGTCCRKTCCKY
jgi:hypothetical protein